MLISLQSTSAALSYLSHLILKPSYEVGTIIIPILWKWSFGYFELLFQVRGYSLVGDTDSCIDKISFPFLYFIQATIFLDITCTGPEDSSILAILFYFIFSHPQHFSGPSDGVPETAELQKGIRKKKKKVIDSRESIKKVNVSPSLSFPGILRCGATTLHHGKRERTGKKNFNPITVDSC